MQHFIVIEASPSKKEEEPNVGKVINQSDDRLEINWFLFRLIDIISWHWKTSLSATQLIEHSQADQIVVVAGGWIRWSDYC